MCLRPHKLRALMVQSAPDAQFHAVVKDRLLLIVLILCTGFFWPAHKSRREQMIECRANTRILFHAEEQKAVYTFFDPSAVQSAFSQPEQLSDIQQNELDYVEACMEANGFDYAGIYRSCLKSPTFRNKECYYRRGRWHKAVFFARYWLAQRWKAVATHPLG